MAFRQAQGTNWMAVHLRTSVQQQGRGVEERAADPFGAEVDTYKPVVTRSGTPSARFGPVDPTPLGDEIAVALQRVAGVRAA